MKCVRLADLCRIQSGGTPTRSRLDYFGGEIPWAKISDIEASDGILASTEEGITEKGLAAIRGRIFPTGTLLFAIYGSIGKMAFAAREVSANQAILGIEIKDRSQLDPRFLFQWLTSIQPRLLSDGQGIAQKNLSAGYVRDLVIPLPTLKEQRRIADILDQADGLRRKRLEGLQGLKRFRNAVFTTTFENLAQWPVRPFGELVASTRIGLVRGASEFGDGMQFPYVRMNAITREGEIDISTIKSTDASPAEVVTSSLANGDFLFNTRNSKELVGKTAVWREGNNSLFNNNIMRVRFNDLAHADFVHAAFSTAGVKSELEMRKTGTTSVFAVYWRDLQTLPIPLPPLELQTAYATVVEQIEAQRARNLDHLSQLEDLYSSLQSYAFRGKS